jgi:DNA-binding transcriptional regulator YhcF (GntR family)
MHQFSIEPKDKVSIVKQITNGIIKEIDKRALKKNDRLMSITDFAKKFKIARVTVEKAYKSLQDSGYIVAVPGKGNFVADGPAKALKVLLVLNKISSYKKTVFESFVKAIGSHAKVDLQIHHYNPYQLKDILDNAKGKYHYYVIMPHFFQEFTEAECKAVLNTVPVHELLLLDKRMNLNSNDYMCVYQDFKQDIYEVLQAENELFGLKPSCSRNTTQLMLLSRIIGHILQKSKKA